MHKIGFGYDIHRLEAGRRLVLGGTDIPAAAGLLGHSDGDALVHAVIDALLGALGEGDIGAHFPDTDPRFEGARSTGLLESVMGLVRLRGAAVVNVDAVIVAEEPKMGPHVPAMKAALSPVLGIPGRRWASRPRRTKGSGPSAKSGPSPATPSPSSIFPIIFSSRAGALGDRLSLAAEIFTPSRSGAAGASPSRCRLNARSMLTPTTPLTLCRALPAIYLCP